MAAGSKSGLNRLLLVGWDAADWKIIDPLLAAGEMPHLGESWRKASTETTPPSIRR